MLSITVDKEMVEIKAHGNISTISTEYLCCIEAAIKGMSEATGIAERRIIGFVIQSLLSKGAETE